MTLDKFQTRVFGFHRSKIERCLYIYRKWVDWIKLINYVADDAHVSLYKGDHNLFRLFLKDCMERKICIIGSLSLQKFMS